MDRIVVEKVRRENALDFSGCNSRPGTGSLHPVAIEAAAEATKPSELSVERVARRLGERTGRNVSERRPRKDNCRSRLGFFTRKTADDGEARANTLHRTCRGNGDGM